MKIKYKILTKSILSTNAKYFHWKYLKYKYKERIQNGILNA